MSRVWAARSLILRALANGKSIVTGNKELIANGGKELFEAADAAGLDLYFEASVGGGIPLIRPLKESLAGERRRVHVVARCAQLGGDVAPAAAVVPRAVDEDDCAHRPSSCAPSASEFGDPGSEEAGLYGSTAAAGPSSPSADAAPRREARDSRRVPAGPGWPRVVRPPAAGVTTHPRRTSLC